MNRYFSSLFLLLYGGLCCGGVGAEYPEVEKARISGALGQVTLHILDSTNQPVVDAKYSTAFWASDSSADAQVREGTTDTNGNLRVEGKTIGDMTFTIIKEGFYKTTGKYWFFRPSGVPIQQSSSINPVSGLWLYHQDVNSVQNGRWQPWGPTNTVILKERRNPTPMYALNVDASIPLRDKPAGYDLEVGDWISPYGKGKVPDLWITYSADIADILTFSNRLVIAGNDQGDGFQRNEKEAWSSFVSAYEAPLDGYLPEVVLSVERTKNQIIKRELLGESEYLFVRTRTTLDQDGNVSSARYAKIYGPIEYGDDEQGGSIVRFIYFLNPTPNDRNMEFDPDRNLLSGHGNTLVTTP